MRTKKPKKAFTLIELLIVIGLIAILALVVFILIDPAERFAQARNSQRWSDITTILNSVKHYQADNEGDFPPFFPRSPAIIGDGTQGTYDADKYMSPFYLPDVPQDPRGGSSSYTCYSVSRTTSEGGAIVTVRAECAELNEAIELKW
jgi:prepilin-type N-terminal cleavage/methylation domain-containing protein